MAKLTISSTKSNLLSLRRQLAFAEEGYDLLEEKRQVLIFELMSRLRRAQEVERAVGEALPPAYSALREALLDIGSEALDRAALAVRIDHPFEISDVRLMGIELPRVSARSVEAGVQFGVGGTSAHTDAAMQRFVGVVPLLAELGELQTSMFRLAMELRRTQRRCNALSKILIPNCRDTIRFIESALEERERESFVILKLIRGRQARHSRSSAIGTVALSGLAGKPPPSGRELSRVTT
jgi:V/A-type H+/Na+-transporting ATPase subunit D